MNRIVTDVFGILTIALVSVLVIFGLLCIFYSIRFHREVRKQGYSQLGYFNKPWIIRIIFILFAIWSGLGEIVRLNLLRHGEGRLIHTLVQKWQEGVCKLYVVSNLGLAEPCLFLTFLFMLHASMKRRFEDPRQNWTRSTVWYILLYCLPIFVLQLAVVLIGSTTAAKIHEWKVPHYFTSTSASSVIQKNVNIALCTYPLLSTVLLWLYATLVVLYSLWLEMQMVYSAINNELRKRVLFLFAISGLILVRVGLLGLSVLSSPEQLLHETLVFGALLVLLSCAGLGIYVLVFCPVTDLLDLQRLWGSETNTKDSVSQQNAIPLDDNQNLLQECSTASKETKYSKFDNITSVKFMH